MGPVDRITVSLDRNPFLAEAWHGQSLKQEITWLVSSPQRVSFCCSDVKEFFQIFEIIMYYVTKQIQLEFSTLRSRVIPPGFLVDPEGLCHKIQPLAVVLYRSGWTNRCRPCRNMPVRRWGNLGVVVTDVVPIDCGETQRRWKVFFVEFVVCRCWIWQKLQELGYMYIMCIYIYMYTQILYWFGVCFLAARSFDFLRSGQLFDRLHVLRASSFKTSNECLAKFWAMRIRVVDTRIDIWSHSRYFVKVLWLQERKRSIGRVSFANG